MAAKMLSGRYLTDMLQRHGQTTILEDVCYQHAKSSSFQAHWSIFSSSVPHSNQNDLLNLATRISGEHHAIGDIIKETFSNQNYLQTMQLLLGPSVMPIVIQAVQNLEI